MEKTKKFVESELQKYEDLYWKVFSQIEEKEKEIKELQHHLSSLKTEIRDYDTQRKYFQELYNEFNPF